MSSSSQNLPKSLQYTETSIYKFARFPGFLRNIKSPHICPTLRAWFRPGKLSVNSGNSRLKPTAAVSFQFHPLLEGLLLGRIWATQSCWEGSCANNSDSPTLAHLDKDTITYWYILYILNIYQNHHDNFPFIPTNSHLFCGSNIRPTEIPDPNQ